MCAPPTCAELIFVNVYTASVCQTWDNGTQFLTPSVMQWRSSFLQPLQRLLQCGDNRLFKHSLNNALVFLWILMGSNLGLFSYWASLNNNPTIIIINIKGWAIWPVPSPELQLLSPTSFRFPDCSLSLWIMVVCFERNSVVWHSLQV